MATGNTHQKADAGKRFRRPSSTRLRSSSQFRACYDGQRAGDAHLLLFAAPGELSHPRAGVSVSKKHGNAVQRNRKKRLLREAFRLVRDDLPALDFVLVPRQDDRSTVEDYKRSLIRLARRLHRSSVRSH